MHIAEEAESEERAWDVVQRAFLERERVSWPRRHARQLALAAAVLGVVAAAVTPPGLAVLGSLREAVGKERAVPALSSLPAPGRLLVESPKGIWVVQEGGSRRLLGDYREGSWSPFGRFVAAARQHELLALEPQGEVRWSLARRDVRFPRWTGSRVDTRIAYLTGSRLHVVAGDGTRDVDICGEPAAARIAPAWRPGNGFVLAYATTRGRVYVLDAAACSLSWRSAPYAAPRALAWSSDGTRLALVTQGKVIVFHGSKPTVRVVRGVVAAAFAPGKHELALLRAGELLLLDVDRPSTRPRRLFAGAGVFSGMAWSPNGRWLALGWQSADQWLFVRADGSGRVRAYSGVGEQFGGGGFPEPVGWCCARS
jgi:hypothetical protein